MKRIVVRSLAEAPAVLAAAWSVWFLVLFWPGNLSVDSFWQYDQAVTGIFSDHHPPVMAVLLRLVLELGGDIGVLVAVQWLAGASGIYALTHTLARLFLSDLPTHGRRAVGNVVVLMLASPLTPTSFYLVTFWKDSWVVAGLSWAVASMIWLLAPRLSRVGRQLSLAVFLASSLFVALARHNAVVLMPVCALALGYAYRARGLRWAITTGALPILLFVGTDRVIRTSFDVERRHLENATLLHDVLEACRRDCSDHARWWFSRGKLDRNFYLAFDVALFEEWKSIYANDPAALLETKWKSYGRTLNLKKGPKNYIMAGIDPSFDRPGIAQSESGRSQRAAIAKIANALPRTRLLRPLLASHGVWLALSIAGVAFFVLRMLRERSASPETMAGLVPFAAALAYYLSYAPVWTNGAFRYMYPATLVCQTAALLLVVLSARRLAGTLSDRLRRGSVDDQASTATT